MWLSKEERQILLLFYKYIGYDDDGRIEFCLLDSINEFEQYYPKNDTQKVTQRNVIINRLLEYELLEVETGNQPHVRHLVEDLYGKSMRLTLKGWDLAKHYSTCIGTVQQWYIAHREHWLFMVLAFICGIIVTALASKVFNSNSK